jgi:hypothetical protein
MNNAMIERVVEVSAPQDLAAIYDDDVVAVVWRAALVGPAALPTPSGRLVFDGTEVPAAALGHGPLLDIVEVFASLADTTAVGVRWRTSSTPMCPAWHVDQVELRGCLTLVGPGTELLLNEGERLAVGAGDLVVMKGTLLHPRGCRHRSPHHGDTDRVVVTLDIT